MRSLIESWVLFVSSQSCWIWLKHFLFLLSWPFSAPLWSSQFFWLSQMHNLAMWIAFVYVMVGSNVKDVAAWQFWGLWQQILLMWCVDELMDCYCYDYGGSMATNLAAAVILVGPLWWVQLLSWSMCAGQSFLWFLRGFCNRFGCCHNFGRSGWC